MSGRVRPIPGPARRAIGALGAMLPAPALAAGPPSFNPIAVGSFMLVIGMTLGITYWAARRTRTADDFYVASSRISGAQNGLAIAGDFMSAATFLGITGLFFLAGFDVVIYILAPVVSFSLLLFLMTERLRNLGRYTFTDVLCHHLDPKPMRTLAAVATLVSAIMYLIVQIVGAGALLEVLLGIDYSLSVSLVSVLMVLYVAFGGMLATTWVQIVKAVLLLSGVAVLAGGVLLQFGFDLDSLQGAAVQAHPQGEWLLAPGGLSLDFISAVSLAFGMTFGIVGSPHILMRFFTVPDAAAASKSAFVAILAVSFVFVLIFYVVSMGAIALITDNPAFLDAGGDIRGGSNMVAVHLAEAIGGPAFLGVISAVAFATILAVVAGLTLASASAVSHDLYAGVVRHGRSRESEEVWVFRITTGVIGALIIVLGIAFERQNIAYLVSLALTVAASTNFPVLILAMYWPGLTTRGAVIGGAAGLVSSVLFVVLGPAVWVSILGFDEPIFPSAYPAIYSMSIAFGSIWLISRLDRSERGRQNRAAFVARNARAGTSL